MKLIRTAGALTAAALLAVPAAAAAHGTVYEATARVLPSGPVPPTQAGLDTQVRYVVTNHGFTMVLRESNGLADHGMLNYGAVPSAYRNQPGYEPGPAGTRTRLLAEADTGVQPHATCQGVPALADEAAILAWQGADPFYGYVPFQTEAAGLEDDPAKWIAVVRDVTGVDLATADPAAACSGLGGTLVAADAGVTSAAALAAGTVEQETVPLTAQIATLTKAVTDADAAKATVQRLLDAARGELAELATPVTVTLPSASTNGKRLAQRGTTVTVGGVAGAAATVRLSVSEARARKLGLRSSVLASAKATFGADGSARVALRPGQRARRALRSLKRPIAMTVTARAGDRIATSRGTITR